jgi:hypothetical protein
MNGLEQHEIDTIGQCLRAVAFGPFLMDRNAADPWWELHSLIGLGHADIVAIAERWPHVDLQSPGVRVAVGGSMNNLLGYPHRSWDAWPRYISVPPEEIRRVLEKWLALGQP